MQTNITRFISCLVSLMLCIHTGASALFYSTILNSRRQMALAAALAAKDQEEFERQIKRAKRFAKENKALSATGVGVSAGLGIGGLACSSDNDNPKTFFWNQLITGKKSVTQREAFMGNVFYLMPWLYGVLPAALSLKQSIGDEKSAALIMTQGPFVHRLMQSPQFLKDIGLDDPQRMHRMVKKMERVALSLQILLTTISGLFGFYQLYRMPNKSLRKRGSVRKDLPLALATLTAVITTPFFAFAFKPLLLAIWRKIAGVPDMKNINKAIMHAIAHKAAWEAVFATEDAAKTSAPIAAVPVATQEEAA